MSCNSGQEYYPLREQMMKRMWIFGKKENISLSVMADLEGKTVGNQVVSLKRRVANMIILPAFGKWTIDTKVVDKEARILWLLYRQALYDQCYLPLTEKKGRQLVIKHFPGEEKTEAEALLFSKLAQEAMALYRLLPATGKEQVAQMISQDDRELVWVDCAVYEETRKALLQEVARQWVETSSEAEADQCFVFLMESASDRKYLSILFEAIRLVNTRCSFERLQKTMEGLVVEVGKKAGNRLVADDPSQNLEELYALLAKAWAKKVIDRDTWHNGKINTLPLARMFLSLKDMPPAVWAEAVKSVERIASFAELAKTLLASFERVGFPDHFRVNKISLCELDDINGIIDLDIDLGNSGRAKMIDTKATIIAVARNWLDQNPDKGVSAVRGHFLLSGFGSSEAEPFVVG